jgi:hypothetical protein
MFVDGILLVYHHPVAASSPTIMEHVESFERYSKFKVWKVNTACGFPYGLRSLEFSAIVLHYSLFGSHPFSIPEKFWRYVEKNNKSLKIAFFQDEMQYCQQRFAAINRLGIGIIYSLLEPQFFEKVYYKNTTVKKVLHTLTGYVCDSLVEKSARFVKPLDAREIDVGYRARQLPFYMGRGAQEKTDIAIGFVERCKDSNLYLDIKTDGKDRFYGDDWGRFVANCKFMLGVESGTSIFDLNGDIQPAVNQYLLEHPNANFAETEQAILNPFEENINYRAISPRIFECAVSRTCMVFFKGSYQGILIPDRHYIALEKDFSNFDEVLSKMRDSKFTKAITENSYNDLISAGRYHYSKFIESFDETLVKVVHSGGSDELPEGKVSRIINGDAWLRNLYTEFKQLRHRSFPGRVFIRKAVHKLGYKKRH